MESRVLMLVCSMAVVLPVVAMATGDVSFMEMLKIKDEWSDWKTKFGKSYSPREDMYRRHVFYQNLRKVHEHNALYPAVHSHFLGLNQFSDLTVQEYRAFNRLLPLTHKIRDDICSDKYKAANTSSPLPSTVDWRTKGYVTPIKDQGQCGSCWAFSTVRKSYSPREDMYRRHVFYQNLRKVHEHNALYPAVHSHFLGLNQFSDLTVQEYRAFNRLLPLTHKIRDDICSDKYKAANTSSPLPSTVDWRTKGYVTPIKDQGQCGSCWAFSTTGSVEGQHFKSTGVLLSLSEQQLVDCSYPEGNQGCDGGLQDNAFHYIMKQPGGLETESEYPYVAVDVEDCSARPSLEKAPISGCVDVESGSEGALQYATANIGPISVGIDASHDSFQNYYGGVYYEPDCSSSQLDHGVLVVGYGTYQGGDYWLVKNSWGTNWGMNGYIMMARNQDNMCGIATSASYPTV